MKSIERAFNVIQEKNPFWSSYVAFGKTVEQEQPNYRILKQWFIKLVDKNDYVRSEKTQLLTHLKSLITPPGVYKSNRLIITSDPKKVKTYIVSI